MKWDHYLYIVLISLIFACKKKQEKEIAHQEPYRNQLHFSPAENWMNDPNGLVYDGENYHLFYQYYPDSTVWGPMHWGHAVSKDLLHWQHKPIALYPDSLGYIFSGSAVIDKENTAGFGKNAMIAVFTYHNANMEKSGSNKFQYQGMAYSLDKGDTWTKYEGNPIIKNPLTKDFRDPKVFWYEPKKRWQMALVAGDHVEFYESANVKEWQKLSEFKIDTGEQLGVWECPDLFELAVEGTDLKKWVLIISHGKGAPNGGSGTRYFIGNWDGNEFTTEQSESKWIDYGTDNYAGVTYNNAPDNRRIFIGWMSNWDYATTTPTKKWRSAMTLPRELHLMNNKEEIYMVSPVIKEFESLKDGELLSKKDLSLEEEFDFESPILQQSEINLTFTNLSDAINITFSNDNDEEYQIEYSPDDEFFKTFRDQSGLSDFNNAFIKQTPQLANIGKQDNLKLKIIWDASAIEIYIQDGLYAVTNQIFPTLPYTKMQIQSADRNATIENLEIRSLKGIW